MYTDIAPAVREDFRSGQFTKAELGRKYKCHPETITNILNRPEDRDVYNRTTEPGNLLITPYMEYIRDLLKKANIQATVIYEKLLEKGACMSLSTVLMAVKSIKHELDLSAIRYETTPGQQAQADWTSFKGYTANIDGYERPLYALFLVLGYSRTKYVEFVTEMKTATLIRCIENALNYYGGTPKEILFDNMPQVVNRCLREGPTHILERELVPEFTSFADYYGFDIVLARIRRPQEKGKVERFVKHFKDNFIPQLDKKTGNNLNELNELALKWCNKVNARVHNTTKEKPFDRLPNEGLRELPSIPYYEENRVTIHKDGSVYFRGRVFYVDESLAGCTGEVIDLEDTLFIQVDGRSFFLGVRKLPVYIRKRYSKTKQEVKGQKRKKKKTGSLEKWMPRLYSEDEINWRELSVH